MGCATVCYDLIRCGNGCCVGCCQTLNQYIRYGSIIKEYIGKISVCIVITLFVWNQRTLYYGISTVVLVECEYLCLFVYPEKKRT